MHFINENIVKPPRGDMMRLRVMYFANILIAGPLGLAYILAPDPVQGLMGIPPGDPIVYGIATGAIPLAFGLAGAFGLRYPLKTSPVLLLQAGYKSLWLVGVLLPHAVTSGIPAHGISLTLIFVFFIVGDLVAVPFSYVFAEVAVETG
jgi:hypothetical protein